MTVVSNDCGLKWMWSQMNVVSNDVVSNDVVSNDVVSNDVVSIE